MLLNANNSIVRWLDRYNSRTHRSPTKAVDVENNKANSSWRRHGHLLFGVTIVVMSLFAVTALQLRATSARTATQSAMALALDAVDSLQADGAAEASAALHQKMLAAVESLAPSSETAETASLLARIGPSAIAGDVFATQAYDVAVRDLVRDITRDTNVATVRTQQIQMGIVAGAAIALVLLIGSVAARRHPEPTSRKSRSHHPSQTDPLTGLGRVDAIRDRLNELLEAGKPGKGFVGMLAVGIQPEHEHFLPLTRSQLDAALLETSRRLRDTVRATDTVARLARDELAVALPSSPRIEDPGRVASKILGELDRPIDVGDAVVRPNPRVGIAISPLDAITPDGLIQRSRLARRAASDSPAAVYRSYSEDLVPSELGSLEMHADLAAALEANDGQLWVAYQPKIDLNSERVVGFEALARWDHPVRGPISPAEFIAVAEETQLIVELGKWVLDSVCAQIANWEQHIQQRLPVSVNVSGRQFENPGLAADVFDILQRHSVDAELLELELTEGILLEDRLELITMMQELSELGVKIAVDDFGTGYSALSYLKRFPIDVLKIDRAFIRDLHGDESDEAISTAIISMAHSLALSVVAEGVETPEQLSVLRSLGCDAAQGFYFAHPAPPNEIETRALLSS